MKHSSNLFNLIRMVVFPYFKEHRIKVLISVVGVALGVAVFIAIQSASYSAKKAMANFISSISVNADLQITSEEDGLDESLYPIIKKTKGVQSAVAIISTKVPMKLENRYYTLLVLGLDMTKTNKLPAKGKSHINLEKFISLPNQIIVSEGFLEKYHLNRDSRIHIVTGRGTLPFEIAGVLAKGETPYSEAKRLIIMDFYSAQYYFGKINRIDKVNVKIRKGFALKEVERNLGRSLGDLVTVKSLNDRLGETDQIYQSFNLNLTVVSLISLLVGMYLIFNTINNSILQQRKEIGILRALGTTKKDILMLFSLEGLLIGIIGSIIGIFLGWFLAYFSVETFTHNLSQHYLMNDVRHIHLSTPNLVIAFVLGIGMTLISSFFPALAAIRISPVETIRSVSYENTRRYKVNLYSILGVAILVLAYISSQIKPIHGIPIFAFLSNLLIILGLSFLTPMIMEILIKGIRPVLQRFFGIETTLASHNLLKATGRNSITISALMISLALIISVFTLIESYHHTIGQWFNRVNNAEISITKGSPLGKGEILPMEESIIEPIKNYKMIETIDYYRFYRTTFKGHSLDIFSFKMNVARDHMDYVFIEGDKNSAFKAMENGDNILISEDLAERHQFKKGDEIVLKTKMGEKSFTIAGIVVNFSSGHGVVSMGRERFNKYWKSSSVDIFKVYLTKGSDPEVFRTMMSQRIDKTNNLNITTFTKVKRYFLDAIDKTFNMFHALELITVIIAIMGVVNALLASILERKREIGILRAIGATKKQIGWIILSEAGLIGFISVVIGVVGGVLLSLVTVFVINKQTVGWNLDYSLPINVVLIVSISMIILTALAGYFPSRQTFKIVIREALEYE